MSYSREKLANIIKKNIRKYRKESNYTSKELADKLNLTHGYIRDVECLSRDKIPNVITLGKIASVFNIEIKELFREEGEKYE